MSGIKIKDSSGNWTNYIIPLVSGGTGSNTRNGAAKNLELNIRTYTAPSDFGCTYDSTITNFYSSLPNDSLFMCDASNLTDSSWNLSNKNGTIIVCKKSSTRTAFYFVGKNQALGIQIRLLETASGTTTIGKTWHKLACVDDLHPVGSIYISYTSTSPASLFGGTWTQIKDRFLLGVGSTYTSITTGGSATHSHTTVEHYHTTSGHTLTISEIPNHNHAINEIGDTQFITSVTGSGITIEKSYGQRYQKDSNNQATRFIGGGESHSHGNTGNASPSTNSSSSLPPYQTVYIWRRTA